MDPLSVGASVLTIAETVVGALKIIEGLHSAPAEIHSLINVVSDVQVVIREVHSAVSQRSDVDNLPTDSIGNLEILLNRARTKLLDLDQIVRCRLTTSEGEGLVSKTVRVRWLRERGRVVKLQKELTDIKLNIAAVWGAANSLDLSRIHVKLENIQFVTESLSDAQEAFEKRNEPYLQEQQRLLSTLADHLEKLGINERAGVSSTKKLTNAGNTFTKTSHKVSWPGAQTSGTRSAMQTTTGVRVRVVQNLKQSCFRWCSCRCHKKGHFQTPAILNKLMGQLFVGYTSLPFLASTCNEKMCRQKSNPSVRISYYFPPWFMMRAMLFMATHITDEGPEMLLKMTRTCPRDAEIFFFAATGNTEGIKSLFEKGLASPYDVTYGSGTSALHKACDWRHIETAQLLLAAGANPFLEAQGGWTPADSVSQMVFHNTTGNQTAFDELLRSLDSNIFDALQFSNLHKIILNLFSADLETQLQMSTAEIDLPDSGGQTPLFWAALRGDEKSVITLLKYGANTQCTSNVGEVALHWSIEASDDACTRRLLEGGADPNARSHFGATALHYAAWTHDDPTKHLQPLVDHGADVNIQSFEGHTPLHYAASVSSDFTAPAEFLLSRGADLEIKDNKGNTSLMEAMRNNLPNVAEYLLHRGANPTGVSKTGENILHIAASKGGIQMFKMLEEKHIDSVDPDAVTLADLTPREILAQRHDRPEGMFEAFEGLIRSVRWTPGKEGAEYIGIQESKTAEEGEEEENFEDALEEQGPETPLPQYKKLDILIQA